MHHEFVLVVLVQCRLVNETSPAVLGIFSTDERLGCLRPLAFEKNRSFRAQDVFVYLNFLMLELTLIKDAPVPLCQMQVIMKSLF